MKYPYKMSSLDFWRDGRTRGEDDYWSFLPESAVLIHFQLLMKSLGGGGLSKSYPCIDGFVLPSHSTWGCLFFCVYKGKIIAMQIAAERLPTAFHVHGDSVGWTLRLGQIFGAIGFHFGTLLSFELVLQPHAKVI